MIIDFCNYILFDPKITKYHKNNTDPRWDKCLIGATP